MLRNWSVYNRNRAMPTDSRKVCSRESTGRRMVMCFTRVPFHRNRMMKVRMITKAVNTSAL